MVVLSVFVSRLDTAKGAVDEQLSQLKTQGIIFPAEYDSLKGRAAVAATKVVYQLWKKRMTQGGFPALQAQGAHLPLILLASTGAKAPYDKDEPLRYVQPLIAPDVGNTLPPEIYQAFKEKGAAKITMEDGLEQASALIKRLQKLCIDLEKIGYQLLEAGLTDFEKAYNNSLGAIKTAMLSRNCLYRYYKSKDEALASKLIKDAQPKDYCQVF